VNKHVVPAPPRGGGQNPYNATAFGFKRLAISVCLFTDLRKATHVAWSALETAKPTTL